MVLLEANKLPYQDLISSGVSLLVALDGDTIAGCIGLEQIGSDGLLRSFAVADAYKNKGVGSTLFNKLIEKSRFDNVETLHLLTTTAEKYFSKKGFITTDRMHAPHVIRMTSEFASICPSNSTYMNMHL